MFSVFAKKVTAVKRGVPSLLRAATVLGHWECRQNTAVNSRERGFTMTELMIAVGIAAIFTAVATPSLMSVIAVQRVKTAAFDLYSAASYARNEAIKRSAVVTIVPRNGAFSNGYDLVVGGTVLRSQAASPGVSISAPIGLTLAFDDSGRLTTPARYQLELTSGQVTATPKRCVIISTTGRPTIHVDNNQDGNCING
jgi:type IV fimbrial biogenesis protein FimT